ncbi:DUF742 domain-containing protein [Saccharomonospora iraqiensis]|uniref:DUF742 domain-containing protein n=1 Tax=Saccharomonospora iraqiensis TaxID=52698 RepID=UPI0004298068|nr:DUF742 domain-containing protein [Saccharomonospora iraqiensis]
MGTSDDEPDRADGHPVGPTGDSTAGPEPPAHDGTAPADIDTATAEPGDATTNRGDATVGGGSLFEPAPGRGTPPRPERIVMSPGDPPDAVRGHDDRGHDDPDHDPDESTVHRLRARPYVLTKGRTHARPDLAVETLVSTDPTAPWHRHLGAQHQAVRRLCAQPRSVAEIAATLSVPLGVARVLVSDLADTGFVRVHAAPPTSGGRPGPELMNRVLVGLQRL